MLAEDGAGEGGPHHCVGGWEGGGQAAEGSCESLRRAGLLLPWPCGQLVGLLGVK